MTDFTGSLKRVRKNGNFAEQQLTISGSAFVSIDITACEKDVSLSVAVKDTVTNETHVTLGETLIPSGAFLSFFVRKMVSNKVIMIRTTEDVVIWSEIERV